MSSETFFFLRLVIPIILILAADSPGRAMLRNIFFFLLRSLTTSDIFLAPCLLSLRLFHISAEVGDIIHSVNGQEMWGKSLAEYTDRLKGPSGSMVPLTPVFISAPPALAQLLLFCFAAEKRL